MIGGGRGWSGVGTVRRRVAYLLLVGGKRGRADSRASATRLARLFALRAQNSSGLDEIVEGKFGLRSLRGAERGIFISLWIGLTDASYALVTSVTLPCSRFDCSPAAPADRLR
jgi:hypothetical protein